MVDTDPNSILNRPHVPADAGELTDQLAAILNRIPLGWGRWIDCGPGWYPLIVETDQRLAELDPEYEVHQVKEKFGGLRYYFGMHGDDATVRKGWAIEAEAEKRSYLICETCGADGVLRGGGWMRTTCDEHSNGQEPVKWDD